ncbi:ribosome assembly factor SBDS [archaeon]|nr:ribosome assembly factor SBDS [archaeon]|tara:strand:+ start:3563 stop:4264 length:702 start_codon:yes stop_codon:yes gene_type:complete
MANIDEAVIARYNKNGMTFEILVDCEKALELRDGKNVDINDVVVVDSIFKDVKKGFHAAETDLENVFETKEFNDVAKKIINNGEVQLTAKYRDKLREEKKKNIIHLIHRNAVNPDNNLPHPPQRIEAAIEEAKVKIDEFKNAEDQIKDIVDRIRSVMPIKYETREVAFKIPAEHSGKSFSIIKRFGKLTKEEWDNDGSLLAIVEIPAGLQDELFRELNNLTQGNVESRVVGSK